MAKPNEFIVYLQEMLQNFGVVTAKRMFGGYGLYHDESIFALVIDDFLHVKSDAESENVFIAEGLAKFSYLKNGKACFLPYYRVPEEAVEDEEQLIYWANLGYQAALRAPKKKR